MGVIRVAYYSNQFADKCGHGLARYARELFASLKRVNDQVRVTPVAAWSSMSDSDLSAVKHTTGLQLLPTGRRLTPLLWTFLSKPPVERWLADCVDVVHAVALGYPVATRKPFVVTVHDIGPLTHPEFFGKSSPWIMKRSLAQAVREAGAIICVSESTANEVVSYVGGRVSNRIHVIPEGVSDDFFEAPDSTCLKTLSGLPDRGVPFILCSGKISPRKNIQGLVRAIAKVSDSIPHHLVLAGGEGWGMREIVKELRNPKLRGRIHFLGYVTDEQLRALYGTASVYVHPSLYEGFGLTVLEAMAAGCPVVTSNVYSLTEVAGDAAVLVDPSDTVALANAIEAICTETALAAELVQKGSARAKSFRWDDCARRVVDVYRSVS